MSCANSDSFTVSMICVTFICLITLVMASSTMFNSSGESGHACLISNLRGKAFNFSLLSIMLAVRWSYMAFITPRYISSTLTCCKVLSKTDFEFYQMLSLHLLG